MSTRIIPFFKYQGTGNDFVIIDLYSNPQFEALSTNDIMKICDRRFGIGADGLMYLTPDEDLDFKMVYYNADGQQSSMCGNGGRCIVHLAFSLGIVNETCRFMAIDGLHEAKIKNELVHLRMNNVSGIKEVEEAIVLDTGSPHYVTEVENLKEFDVFNAGKSIRNSDLFKKAGINVNFIEKVKGGVKIRTYERGVEDETLSCGTGNVAGAIAFHQKYLKGNGTQDLFMDNIGGNLSVKFDFDGQEYKNIWLIGPAKMTFKGLYTLDL